MKKLFGMLLVLAVCVLLPATEAKAANVSSGECGENITWTLDDEGTLTLSGEGEMGAYSSTWYPKASVKAVVVQEGITEIGGAAFSGCWNLTRVELPEGLLEIKYSAFSSCSMLTEIKLPDSLMDIEYKAFSGCTGLKEITIPSGVKELGSPQNDDSSYRFYGMVFENCGGLESVVLEDGVEKIFCGTFSNCTNLKEIILPDSLTTIENHAFYKCESLVEITIPSGVETLGTKGYAPSSGSFKTNSLYVGYVFAGCSGLE